MSLNELLDNNWVAEIAGGLITSIIFLVIVYYLRPSMKVSKKIVYNEDDKRYQIKVINNSWFKVLDLYFEAYLIEPYQVPKGQNLHLKPLKLKNNRFSYLRGKYWFWEKNRNSTHAITVSFEDDLSANWDEKKQFISFKVIAKHGLTGFPGIKKEHYNHKGTVIETGSFEWGDSLEIISKN